MRVEFESMWNGRHAVIVVDDAGKQWRTDLVVTGDVRADDGRVLKFRGLALAGGLPRAALVAVILDEFARSDGVHKKVRYFVTAHLRAVVFLATFALLTVAGWHLCFRPSEPVYERCGAVQVPV